MDGQTHSYREQDQCGERRCAGCSLGEARERGLLCAVGIHSRASFLFGSPSTLPIRPSMPNQCIFVCVRARPRLHYRLPTLCPGAY